MKSVLPPLPVVSRDLLIRSDAAHHEVDRLLRSLDPVWSGLIRTVVWRRCVEATAAVGAIDFDSTARSVTIPPRRRYLPPGLQSRLEGTESALVHVDERLRLVRLGVLDHLVDPETPMVLNAFAAARDERGPASMSGLVRATTAGYLDVGAEFVPPSAPLCRGLLEETIAVLRARPPVHPLELAAWASLMLFAVHPFADGNGRTARLLFQLIHSAALPSGFDVGSIEVWARHRRRYVDAIQQASPSGPADSVIHLRPAEFANFAALASIEGAECWQQRIETLVGSIERWTEVLGSSTITYAFIRLERNVAADEFREIGERSEQVQIAECLVSRGLVRRDRCGRYSPVEGVDP